jgi:hypothetical protein
VANVVLLIGLVVLIPVGIVKAGLLGGVLGFVGAILISSVVQVLTWKAARGTGPKQNPADLLANLADAFANPPAPANEKVNSAGRFPSDVADQAAEVFSGTTIDAICDLAQSQCQKIEEQAFPVNSAAAAAGIPPANAEYGKLEQDAERLVEEMKTLDEALRSRGLIRRGIAKEDYQRLVDRVVTVGNYAESLRAVCRNRATVNNPDYEAPILRFMEGQKARLLRLTGKSG